MYGDRESVGSHASRSAAEGHAQRHIISLAESRDRHTSESQPEVEIDRYFGTSNRVSEVPTLTSIHPRLLQTWMDRGRGRRFARVSVVAADVDIELERQLELTAC